MIKMIKSYLSKYKYTLITVLVCIVLLLSNGWSIRQCSKYKDLNNNNIVALTDTIKYYKTKTNEIYVSKTLLEGDMQTLKLANDSLYNVVKEMELKLKNVSTVVYVNSTVDNGKKDTTWTIEKSDSQIVYPNLYKEFEFKNPFRELTGNIFLKDSILGLNIDRDKVFLDYTMAIENNKVYLKSNNPYIQYNKIQGITIPQPKKKITGLVIGPSFNIGYDFRDREITPTIGISITYGIDLFNLFRK